MSSYHSADCTCSKCKSLGAVPSVAGVLPELSAIDRSSLAQVAQLQATKIEVLQRQVNILVQSLSGISASWFNDANAFDENAARILLDYLHACRPISGDIEELYRAVYYSVAGARRREAPVPPPSFEIAPAAFRNSTEDKQGNNPLPSPIKQGDYWRAKVSINPLQRGSSTSELSNKLRSILAEKIFNITNRRIDVYPNGTNNKLTVTICVYDSEDPSAKKAGACLMDICNLLNEAALTVPTGALATIAQLIRLDTLEFVGMAADLASLYMETRNLKKPAPPADISERHWRRQNQEPTD